MSEERNLRKEMIGTVTSDKMDKTVVVSVETSVKHPIYKKIVRRTYKLKAQDEENKCHMGDKVKVMETRPLSATKYFRLVEVVKKIKCPTLAIWGTRDTAVSYDDAVMLEQIMPNCGLVTYEGCSHYAYLENINQTISVLNSFIGDEK